MSVCVCLSLFLYTALCPFCPLHYLSVSQYLFLMSHYFSVLISLSLSLWVFIPVSIYLCLHLCFSVLVSFYLSQYLFFSTCLSISFSLLVFLFLCLNLYLCLLLFVLVSFCPTSLSLSISVLSISLCLSLCELHFLMIYLIFTLESNFGHKISNKDQI